MLYSTIFVAASAFVSFASAQQNSSYSDPDLPIPCCSLPASSIDEDQRDEWCLANRNTCTELCGGAGQLASNGNQCDKETLDYSCSCSNGTEVTSALVAYQQSVPGQMCRAWFVACNEAAPNDAVGLEACNRAQESQCGNLTTSDATNAGNGGGSSSASGSATSGSPSATGSDSTASATESAGAAETTGAEGAGASLMAYGTPALVGGFLAIFGLAL